MAMIKVVLFWTLVAASAAFSILPQQNPVQVFVHDTALLLVSIHFENPAWEYYHVKWVFLTKNHPILVYVVDNCRGAPGTQERTCHHSTELHEVYQQRASISQEASLVLKNVQPEDAGMYQITVQGLDVLGTAQVTLIVEESRQDVIPAVGKEGLSVTTIVRLVLAFLVLCVLGLIVGENVLA
ncbi:uncharacterized protein LOC112548437 isoform X2 [Alligator sinensis]|uniref:Uncharacterized protein LOC112548437 isoform X2 n=1 Tax=Alligator sinensis TaxID=38654 RepID=A0A3Q0FV14_ALLSI|nr:uncharacterized protein LOC112548437 isoform X2 [Alligator sinensis]